MLRRFSPPIALRAAWRIVRASGSCAVPAMSMRGTRTRRTRIRRLLFISPPPRSRRGVYASGGCMIRAVSAMLRFLVSVLLVLLGGVGEAQQPAGTLQQIIPGHYIYTSSTYNSGVIVTTEGVVVL